MSGPVSQDPCYLTLAQASAIVAVSPRTLRRAIASKRLCAHRLGRLVRIDAVELKRWIEADGAAGPRHAGAATSISQMR
ncbi:MAG: helix-turn-helix domain-containing protein [Burkholderiales bacterium]|nr:helix-turn-helix domain-containing protein [Burkholderiales bacterium]